MFDLNAFDTVGNANNGAEIHIENPKTGELCYLDEAMKKPVKILIQGIKSDKARAKQLENMKALSKKKAKANLKRGKNNEVVEDFDFDYDKIVKDQCELLADLTLDFINLLGTDGKPLKFDRDSAYNLYMRYEAIREQVNTFVSDEANFIKD